MLIADDQSVFREMLLALLAEEDDIEVVAEAANGQEAIDLTRRHRPDVVLMDINMPKVDGVEATATIVQQIPSTKIVVVTAFDDEQYVVKLVKAGATGYVLKEETPQVVVNAIRTAYSGEALIQPKITSMIMRELRRAGQKNSPSRKEGFKTLTEREKEVLSLIGRGLNNREIGEKLFISEPTVKTHVANLMHKMGFRDRIEAVLFAVNEGL